MSLTVSIGRNVGNAPLSDDDWRAFKADVLNALSATVGKSDAEFTGHGSWEGVSEESELFLTYEPNLNNKEYLERWLSDIAKDFGQDAIAVTVGSVDFVAPRKWESMSKRLARLIPPRVESADETPTEYVRPPAPIFTH